MYKCIRAYWKDYCIITGYKVLFVSKVFDSTEMLLNSSLRVNTNGMATIMPKMPIRASPVSKDSRVTNMGSRIIVPIIFPFKKYSNLCL